MLTGVTEHNAGKYSGRIHLQTKTFELGYGIKISIGSKSGIEFEKKIKNIEPRKEGL
jgi:hypothetical protein